MDTYYFYTEGLTVGYHGVPLIKDIRIGLKKGEILTLIGPNGAGKTTILKSIIRQLAPLGGVAVLDGKAMGNLSGKELSQKLSVVLTERIHPEMMTCRTWCPQAVTPIRASLACSPRRTGRWWTRPWIWYISMSWRIGITRRPAMGRSRG